jgi:hypothetical protein
MPSVFSHICFRRFFSLELPYMNRVPVPTVIEHHFSMFSIDPLGPDIDQKHARILKDRQPLEPEQVVSVEHSAEEDDQNAEHYEQRKSAKTTPEQLQILNPPGTVTIFSDHLCPHFLLLQVKLTQ